MPSTAASPDVLFIDWRMPDVPDAKFTLGEYGLIKLLLSRANRTMAHESIWTALYAARPESAWPGTEIVKVYVCRLRKKLRGSPWRIINEWGVGYRLERADG